MRYFQDSGKTSAVFDTCALAHAVNDANPYKESSLKMIESLLNDSSLKLVLDDNGKSAPDTQTSLLFHEYHQTLPPQSLPLIMVTTLLQFQRVTFSTRPKEAARKEIRKLIPKNKKDQTILGAASTSESKTLVTNDFDDFPTRVRDQISKTFGVSVISSMELH
ncbi:hypothetical protein GS456_25460 [Rhodococcus hoagii]|nr:hypothetical protein [Prescottella equi]MBM4477217.1 hypothetical protein [Prescottella equi]MBM4478537.1 hypothetical protein [Prescottella equi]